MGDNGGGVGPGLVAFRKPRGFLQNFFQGTRSSSNPSAFIIKSSGLCAFDDPRVIMGDVVRLSLVRKQAARRARELRAVANRIVFGRPKAERKLAEAQREKASRELEALRLDTGEDR